MGLKENLWEILFPPRCAVCDGVMAEGGRICPECEKKVRRICEPVCKKCGKPLGDGRREYCADCTGKRHFFKQGKAVFVYGDGIRGSMYRFKYANRREYARFYADEAIKLYGGWIREKGIGAVVPVPMYARKERGRGYNQAAVFAAAVAARAGLPVERKMVLRVRNTTPQKELNDVERRANLKKAFQLAPNIVQYKKVLLADDIYTTGSTADAVAEVLLGAGVQEVYVLCISIGAGY